MGKQNIPLLLICSCVCMFISAWRCVECQKVSVPYSSSSSHRSSHITLNCLLILLYSIFRITPSSSLDNMFHSSHQHAKLSKNIFISKIVAHVKVSVNDSTSHPIEFNVPRLINMFQGMSFEYQK